MENKDWPEAKVLFEDGSKINSVVIKSTMVAAFNDKGAIAMASLSQPSCGKNNYPEEEKKLGILMDTVEDNPIIVAQVISDFQFFSISKKLLRLWDFDFRRLALSHEIQEGYTPLSNFGRVFEQESDDESAQTEKE